MGAGSYVTLALTTSVVPGLDGKNNNIVMITRSICESSTLIAERKINAAPSGINDGFQRLLLLFCGYAHKVCAELSTSEAQNLMFSARTTE
ncbi:hypothetical protein KIN20_011276 [Parelaphostrongylus tenuis]|uniref:Uncharacterized protein n=1 Tax=Parelaphostrongylus tenuis TaxID=148309 RepID=A0AAD5MUR8_PARTN|nr:hypothetical protein KIN20_011276 [Parelaphostrongylus tenuis]